MEDNAGEIGFQPPHPGEYLREDILPALGMSQKEFADRLGVTRQTLSRLLHEHSGVSTDMAIRLGKALQNGARFWMTLQMQHELWIEERNSDVQVLPIKRNEEEVA